MARFIFTCLLILSLHRFSSASSTNPSDGNCRTFEVGHADLVKVYTINNDKIPVAKANGILRVAMTTSTDGNIQAATLMLGDNVMYIVNSEKQCARKDERIFAFNDQGMQLVVEFGTNVPMEKIEAMADVLAVTSGYVVLPSGKREEILAAIQKTGKKAVKWEKSALNALRERTPKSDKEVKLGRGPRNIIDGLLKISAIPVEIMDKVMCAVAKSKPVSAVGRNPVVHFGAQLYVELSDAIDAVVDTGKKGISDIAEERYGRDAGYGVTSAFEILGNVKDAKKFGLGGFARGVAKQMGRNFKK